MDNKILQGITQATQLTRAGHLKEATAIIQRTLQGFSDNSAVVPTDEIIDVTAEVIDTPISPATPGRTNHQSKASKETQTIPDSASPKPTQSYPLQPNVLTGLWDLLHSKGAKFSGLEAFTPPITPPVSVKGQFIEGSYTRGLETRRYKLYIPSGYSGQALPLIVMLHGCTQSVDDFAAGTGMNLLAEEELFFVLYPAQSPSANSSKCWNWFQEGDQQRDSGEPAIIAGMTEKVLSTYHLDKSQVYVSGLSAGGAMAAIMGICYPDIYAAVGVHSGLPYGCASDLPSAFAAMQNRGKDWGPRQVADFLQQQDKNFRYKRTSNRFVPIIIFHGDRDTTVHPGNTEQLISQWAFIHSGVDISEKSSFRVQVIQDQVNNGHAYTRSIYYDSEGHTVMEKWLIHGAGHAWSGGSNLGSFTDFQGPNASQSMVRFFFIASKNS